jgi:nucleoside-diphosphate-sugar epimerase
VTRVLVTGAGGLLGGAMAQRLAEQGFAVSATGRRPAATPLHPYHLCELADPAEVENLFSGKVEAVIHAAARIRGDDADAFERDNVCATRNLAAAARASGVRLFVLISTISVYSGDGPFTEDSPAEAADLYGRTKRAAEKACLEALSTAVVLRLAGLHGAPRRGGVVCEMFAQARRGRPIEVAEPDTRATLTFIDDVVSAVSRLLAGRATSRIYNLATSEAPTYRELAEHISVLAGGASAIISPPNPRRRNRVLDTSRIRAELGFAPLPLERHLARFAEATEVARA